MNILQKIGNIFTGGQTYSSAEVHRIAEFVKSKEGRRLTAELIRQTDSLTKKDVGMWRQAWQMAINIDTPNGRTFTTFIPTASLTCILRAA